MFLYALLMLLPATTLALVEAPCNINVMWLFYDRLNENKDSNVTRAEADSLLHQLNVNGDKFVTLQEVKQTVGKVAPNLLDYAECLFEIIDVDYSDSVTDSDVDVMFFIVDANWDETVTRPEYARFLKILFPAKDIKCLLPWKPCKKQ